jgi:hypothetical protein
VCLKKPFCVRYQRCCWALSLCWSWPPVFAAAWRVVFADWQGAALAVLGLFLGATAILCLFTGMRIAQDYGGAASITGYFVFFVVALALYAV